MSHIVDRRVFFERAAAGLAAAAAALRNTVAGEAAVPAKFAICNETFAGWPLERAFQFAAECGYQGIEIAPFTISNYVTDISSSERAAIGRQAERAGIQVVGLHWLLARTEGLHLTSPDGEIRRRTSGYLAELARFCADIGGELLVFGSPKQRDLQPGMTREQGMKHAEEVLRSTLPVLEKTAVTIAMEPLSPKTTNFLQTAAEAVELIERIGSDRCRLILDCLAMSTEPTPITDLIRRNGRLLAHFHANDPNRRGPGFGQLQFGPILSALRDIRYGGWISVEVFDYSPGPERLARESLEHLQRTLRELR